MREGFVRRLPTRVRSARVATLLLLASVAVVTALLPAGAGAADGPGAQIYWANEGGSVRVANLDGTGIASVADGEGGPCGIALDPAAGKVYWANFFSGAIRVANLDGSGTPSTLFADVGGPVCGVAVDPAAGKIYWANFGADAIRVANLDGSGVPSTLFQEPFDSSPSGVAIDPSAGKIYWTNQDNDQVRVANLDGSGAASTLFGPADAGDNPLGLAIDPLAGKVYWAALLSDQIRVGNLDGSGAASALFTGEKRAGGIALDAAAGKLYWGNSGDGKLRVGSLDGSGTPATLFDGENQPLFPALLRAPAGEQPPAITGGASLGDALNCTAGSWKADLLGAFLSRAPRTLAYQWQLDGADIPEATAATFTFTEAGDYTCRVTAANQAGSSSQTSAAFTVTLLDLTSFYDANANGLLESTESMMSGWRVQVGSTAYSTPKSLKVDPGVYSVTAASPLQSNWRRTTAASVQASAVAGDRTIVRFGNVCLGAGGGLGTGFWANKNGEALFGSDDLAEMVGLNLRNADGSDFVPGSYSVFKGWIGKTSATNMAYDLSGQLAAMKLNVLNGKVVGTALISALGASSANASGFATVNALMAEADIELGLHGLTKAGSAFRAYQAALRDALFNANGNTTFIQPAPCAVSFG